MLKLMPYNISDACQVFHFTSVYADEEWNTQ